jgi:hypothetical protein
LAGEINNLKVPEWFGEEADLKKECFDIFQDEGAAGFRNLGNIREKNGELVALIRFSACGHLHTLGRHPLWKAAFIVDLYRIHIFDKFIEPIIDGALPHTTNYLWKKDQLENVQYEESLRNLIDCWRTWLESRGFLRPPRVFPKALTDEDREKGRQKEWERRSKTGQRVSAAIDLITNVGLGVSASMDKALLNILHVSENVESRAAIRQKTIDNMAKDISEMKSLIVALCKNVAGVPVVEPANRCLLCKINPAVEGSEHCERCQPELSSVFSEGGS